MITFNKIEEFDESLENFGFRERKIFQLILNDNKTPDEILSIILESDIFFEVQKHIDYSGDISKNYEVKTHHAFTDKIEITDFEKLNYEEFETRIKEIESESDWGVDLPIFSKLINKTRRWILDNNFQNKQLYFIYANSTSKEKLIEFNFYSYFMTIIIISISDSKVIIIDHGED